MKTFYDKPVQVVFHDELDWHAGIAFEDKVICACCGTIYPIATLIDISREEGITNPIYEYKYWVSVTDEITGNYTELPEGLELTEDNQIKEV